MAAESVKIEVLGISTETGEDDLNESSIAERRPQTELELIADENGERARVVLKDGELESSEESTAKDGVEMADGGAGGAEQSSEGADAKYESPALEEEEQEECGFCLFMKGGPCGDRFTIWQNCVDEAEKSGEDIVERCAQTTSLLKVCMEMNLEYYGPVLDAEKAMEEVASQDENQAADAARKPSDQDRGTQDTSPEESESEEKVVEVVGVSSVDGEVIEVVDVVISAVT